MRSSLLLLLPLAVFGLGCAPTQASARDDATEASCDTHERCNQIGPGLKYASRDDCEISYRSFWNDRWPVADCDDRVNPDALELCITGLQAVECSNWLDSLNAEYNKCAKDKVC